jgi:uncharacterized membrane protein YbaN (DUF454 family)
MKKILLLTGGSLCLALGAIGLFLPVLPTTPFVLVAAACFSCYPPVYQRIYKIRFFREYLEAYRAGKGVSTATRVKSLVWLWGMLIISMVIVNKPWLYALLGVIGAAVTVHILLIGRKKSNRGTTQINADEESGIRG